MCKRLQKSEDLTLTFTPSPPGLHYHDLKRHKMKKFLITITIVSFAVLACEKGDGYSDPSLPSTGARVKFINTSWNAPSLIFYGKDTTIKFSAAAPATGNIITGIAYGSTYPSNDYSLLGTYSDSLKVRVPSNSTVMPNFF